MSTARLYIVSYDVACPKRWKKVFKTLKPLGQRSQLSVFICRTTKKRMEKIEARLRRLMDLTEDRLLVSDLGPIPNAANRINANNNIQDLTQIEPLIV